MSKLDIPGFYKFFRHKIKEKTFNKERLGYRGKKQRYAVWRAEYNQKWENTFKQVVEAICSYNNLVVEEHMISHKRTPWEATATSLRDQGYKLKNMFPGPDEKD